VIAEPQAPVEDREPWEQLRAADLRKSKINRARRLLSLQAAGPAALEVDRKLCAGTGPYDVKALLHWLSWYGWMQDPHSTDMSLREATPFDPWPDQEEDCAWLLERLRLRQEAIVPKSRKIGETWLMLHVLVWLFIFHGIGAIVGSRTQQAVDRLHDPDSLFCKLRYLLDRQPPHLRPRRLWDKLLMIVDLDKEVSIRGQSTAHNFARSARELVILLDEPGAIDARRMRSILTSTESAGASLWLPFQPPEGSGHPLEDLCREIDPERVRVRTWKTDPYRPPDFPESKIRPRGRLTREQFRREYNAEFGTAPEGAVWDIPQTAYYDEDDPDWSPIAARTRQVAVCVPGMDFGSGPSSSACPVALYDLSTGRLRVWIDDYREWKRTAYPIVAADIDAMLRGQATVGDGAAVHAAIAWELRRQPGFRGRLNYREPYTGPLSIYGDPAGRAKDSGGVSWEINLRNEGLPLACLDSTFNEATIQRITIQEISDGLIDGWVRIHRRCESSLGTAMRSWLWDTPAGVRPEEVNRAIVLPRKDWPSHACNALCYSFMGAKLELNRQKGGSAPQTRGRGARQNVNDFMRKGRF
jgi:hypothetical protein